MIAKKGHSVHTPFIYYCLKELTVFDKGQRISEWKYEVVALPKIWTKNLNNSALNTKAEFFNFFRSYFG